MLKKCLFILLTTAAITSVSAQTDYDCQKNYSIFSLNAKSKSWDIVQPIFWELTKQCPTQSANVYIYGIQMYESFYNNEKDEVRKSAYADTILMIYDLRLEALKYDPKIGVEIDVMSRKVDALTRYKKDQVELIRREAQKTVNKGGKNTMAAVMSYYMQYTAIMNTRDSIPCDTVIDVYDVLSSYIDENLKEFKNDSVKFDNYTKAQENLDQFAGQCLNCDKMIEIFEKNFDARKNDIDWIKKAAAALDRKKCGAKEEFRDKEIILKIMETNFALDPTAEAANRLARLFAGRKDCEKVQFYVEKALSLNIDTDSKADLYMLLAYCQAEKDQYSSARASARKAAEARKGWGKPYLFIGDLYAASARACSADDPCKNRAVFWAAADKYAYAKSIDPSCTDEANKKLGNAAGNFPTKADCFFVNIKDGDSYTVGCWIGESTTVRTQ